MEQVAVVMGDDGLSGLRQEVGPVAGEPTTPGLERELDWALGGLTCLGSSTSLPWEPEPVATCLPLQPQWSHPPTLGCAVGAPALKTQSLDSSAASVKPGQKKRGPRPRHFAKNTCQVDGCGADLSCASYYYQRNHICPEHLKQESIVVRGVPSRFCQRCGVSHDLASFDGRKKSCRQALARHKQRRLTKLASGSFPELQSYLAEAGGSSLALAQPPSALAAPRPLQPPAGGWNMPGPKGLSSSSPFDNAPLSPQHACSALGDSMLCPLSRGGAASLGHQATLAAEDISCASSMDLYALPDPPLRRQPLWGEQLPEDEDDLFSLLGLPSLGELDDLAAVLMDTEQAGKGQEAVADSVAAAQLAAGPLDGLPAPGSGDGLASGEEGAPPAAAAAAAGVKGTPLLPLLSPTTPQLPQPLAQSPQQQQQQMLQLQESVPPPQQEQVPSPPPQQQQQQEEHSPPPSPQQQVHGPPQPPPQQASVQMLQVQLPGACQVFPVGTTFTLQWAASPAGMQAGGSMGPAWVLVPVPLAS